MLLDICLGNRTTWKMLFVFSEAPGKAISRAEIKKLTKLGNKVISKFLFLLEKFSIITSNKIGKSYYYKLNMANPFTEKIIEIIKLEKEVSNNINFAALNIIREFVYEITNINLENINNVILFGSYAKKTFSVDSDIDIAIIFNKKSTNDELLITDISEKLKNRFGKEIQPHYYGKEEWDKIKQTNKLAMEIYKDGIFLLE